MNTEVQARKNAKAALRYQEEEEKADVVILACEVGRQLFEEVEGPKRKKNKGDEKDQKPVVKEIMDLDTSLSTNLDSKIPGAGDKKIQFSQKIGLSDRNLDLYNTYLQH